MKIALIAIFLYLLTTTLIYSEPTSLIIPLNDSDIPKEIKPLIKEGYRIKYQGFEENLIEFICKDESSASLLALILTMDSKDTDIHQHGARVVFYKMRIKSTFLTPRLKVIQILCLYWK